MVLAARGRQALVAGQARQARGEVAQVCLSIRTASWRRGGIRQRPGDAGDLVLTAPTRSPGLLKNWLVSQGMADDVAVLLPFAIVTVRTTFLTLVFSELAPNGWPCGSPWCRSRCSPRRPST